MRRTVPLVLVGVLMAPLALGSCSSIVDHRGFAATPGSIEKLEAGAQSREDVIRLIGTPSAVATFNPNIWYYISQQQETYAFFKPQIIEQHVLQLTFNDAGRLTTQKTYDLNDGKDITMVARITPTAGKELTILEQLMGNVGRFSGPRQESNPGAPTGGGI
jgi:outer membrane protein assembly factor BamE (lipoprotein component of BamABCDE complex)